MILIIVWLVMSAIIATITVIVFLIRGVIESPRLKTFHIWMRFEKTGWREISCCFAKDRDSVDTEMEQVLHPDCSVLVLEPWETPY